MRKWRSCIAALLLAAPLLAACSSSEPVATVAELPRFCYHTLAKVDCHPYPLVAEEERRVGFYDPFVPLPE